MVKGIEIQDESEEQFKEALSIKEIILRHIRKIGDLSCKEFTGGYWEKKPVRTGSGIMFSEVYHDDIREAYCNAVDFLIDIIYPVGDEDLKKYLEKNEGFGKNTNDRLNEIDKMDIKDKLKLKRQTFRQINIMFEQNDFFKGTTGYNE